MLLVELLLQPKVQRRLADATLQLAERALLHSIRTAFDLSEEGVPTSPTGGRGGEHDAAAEDDRAVSWDYERW